MLPFEWTEHLQKLNADEFKRRYRLPPEGFYELLTKLWPELHKERQGKGAAHASNRITNLIATFEWC